MNKISTYIFIHDQQLLLDCERKHRFSKLPDIKYVFLGNGNADNIKDRKDIIIARDLQFNIEQYPKFCSFTGWYALWKNNLIDSEYVHLFEYDILIRDKFNSEVEKAINNKYDFIGYVPMSVNFGFINPIYLANLDAAIKKNYIGMKEKLDDIINNKKLEWSSTSNSTFYYEVFNEYMTWFEELIDDLKNNRMCGHAHERSISFFYLLFNKKIILIKNIFNHFMLNSHGT